MMPLLTVLGLIVVGLLTIFAFGAVRLIRKLGAKGTVIVIAAVLASVWGAYQWSLPSDAESFYRFTSIALPKDASGFDWQTKNYDWYGDHDGTITFSASAESLKKVAESPLAGESPWESNPSGTVFTLNHQNLTLRVTATIDLRKRTFPMEYSSV